MIIKERQTFRKCNLQTATICAITNIIKCCQIPVSDKTELKTCQKQCNILLLKSESLFRHSLESFVQESDYTSHAVGF